MYEVGYFDLRLTKETVQMLDVANGLFYIVLATLLKVLSTELIKLCSCFSTKTTEWCYYEF